MGFTRSKSIAILTHKDKKQVKTLLGVAEGHNLCPSATSRKKKLASTC